MQRASEREKGKRGPTKRRDGARVIKKKNGERREKEAARGSRGSNRTRWNGETEKTEPADGEERERERVRMVNGVRALHLIPQSDE